MAGNILRCGGRMAVMLGMLVGLGACSSSFGGGSSPPANNTVIIPPGARVVCSDGSAPPCN